MSMPEASFLDIRAKPPGPKELLARHDLRPRKSLGQHFLARYEVAERIVELSGVDKEATVVELGAGLGILTHALAQRVRRVIAYEIDPQLMAILEREAFLPSNVEVRRGDILKLDYPELSREVGQRLVLFGNLPYYLSSRLLFELYERREAIALCVFMFQKEVVDRLLSPPGTKLYGILSVLTALLTEAKRLMNLSPAQFYPPPEVASAVIKLRFRDVDCPFDLFRLIKTAFSRRRKKLIRNLSLLKIEPDLLEGIFRELDIPLDIRAEALPPEKYLLLARRLEFYKTIKELE